MLSREAAISKEEADVHAHPSFFFLGPGRARVNWTTSAGASELFTPVFHIQGAGITSQIKVS